MVRANQPLRTFRHYQRIIVALTETARIMVKVDAGLV